MRIDKWLWAARFFKTRQLAVKAIKTGKIKINGIPISKPAHSVSLENLIDVKRGLYRMEIQVLQLNEHRGPAKQAQLMYQETENSINARNQLKSQLAAQPKIQFDQRKPDKRGLRSHRALKRGED